MNLEWFPEDVTECQNVCALRFDGYQYLESFNQDLPEEKRIDFDHLTDPVIEKFELHEEQNHNFAAFFALQRYLFKWGGDRLTKYSEKHMAFDFLFLALYRSDPPKEFLDQNYAEQWRTKLLPDVERHAAFVRRSFSRVGDGPKIR
ncbi:MAG: hypothetical protein RL117_316 [Verrucomicrobiota bacterium]|jgi:hypothetical protein